MPTTYHVTNFRNKVVNVVTGNTSTNSATLKNITEIWSGTQPSDPSVTPSGSLLASVTVGTGAWSSPSAGISVLSNPLAGTGSATGTASFARVKDTAGGACIDVTCGVAGSGAGCTLDTLSITNGGAFQITNMSMKMPDTLGTMKLNMELRNKLVDIWCVTAGAPQMGVSGTVSSYTGSAPASADDAASGTKLVDLPTGGSTPWSAAVGGSAALGSNLSANAVASGTAGYSRWTKGLYAMQGSVGTSATDFILDSLTITNGNPVTLTEANVTF